MAILFDSGISNGLWEWDYVEIRKRLQDLVKAEKSTHWIHLDISTSPSSCPGRLVWRIAKHFNCLRDMYFIHPKKSASLLQRLWNHIKVNQYTDLEGLYIRAIENFTDITGHCINLPNPQTVQMPNQVVEQTPIVVERTPIIVEQAPIVVERTPMIIEHHHPVVIGLRPALIPSVRPPVVSKPRRIKRIAAPPAPLVTNNTRGNRPARIPRIENLGHEKRDPLHRVEQQRPVPRRGGLIPRGIS